MFKSILSIFSLLCIFSFAQAQTTCKPDIKFKDSTGVFPRPFSPQFPNGGIPLPACIGKPYDFTFTASFPAAFSGLPLDYVRIDSTSKGISGLPAGLSFICNPPGCRFKALTPGCLRIIGTPTAANAVKDYPLIFNGFLKLSIAAETALSYPSVFPINGLPNGDYILKLLPSTCNVSTTELPEGISKLTAFYQLGNIQINMDADRNLNGSFILRDIVGRQLDITPFSVGGGPSIFEISADQLTGGMYVLEVRIDNQEPKGFKISIPK
jgi:hypothetical protein